MKPGSGRTLSRVLLISLIGWTVAALFQKPRILSPPPDVEGKAVCVLALRGWKSPSMEYSAGFHYELLRRFGQENPWDLDISVSGMDQDSTVADLVVLPWRDSLEVPASCYLSPIWPDSTVWVIREDRENLVRSVYTWTGHFLGTEGFSALKDRFTPSYDPFRFIESGQRPARISPYDALLKEYAGRIGWDWRLLSALAWSESKFRIEVRSGRGAEGLMQMMPRTARRHKAENLLDPEDNLRAAAQYLDHLQKMFAEDAEDGEELLLFTLAAYNAGEGRIKALIRQADTLGIDRPRWSDLEALLPHKEEDTASEEETGDVQEHETVRFIARIRKIYEVFRILVP